MKKDKLVAIHHNLREFHSKYMVCDNEGFYIGSSMIYIKKDDLKIFHCPTVFNNRKEAEDFIDLLK